MTQDPKITEMWNFIYGEIYLSRSDPTGCKYSGISPKDKQDIAEAYKTYFVGVNEVGIEDKMSFWREAVGKIPSPNPLEKNLELLAEQDRMWAFSFILGLGTNPPCSGVLSDLLTYTYANR